MIDYQAGGSIGYGRAVVRYLVKTSPVVDPPARLPVDAVGPREAVVARQGGDSVVVPVAAYPSVAEPEFCRTLNEPGLLRPGSFVVLTNVRRSDRIAAMAPGRTGSLETLRRLNRLRVIHALRDEGLISRAEIARRTGPVALHGLQPRVRAAGRRPRRRAARAGRRPRRPGRAPADPALLRRVRGRRGRHRLRPPSRPRRGLGPVVADPRRARAEPRHRPPRP